jgi:hypothetical protein
MSSSPPVATPPPRQRKLLPLALKLSVVAFSLFISLLIAEFAVRLFKPQHPSWLNFYANSDVPPYGLKHNLTQTISNGVVTWTVYTDDKGFRVPKSPAQPNAPILLALGDSFVFGFAVDYEQTMPGVMQQKFADRYHVINAAVPGYGPMQYRQVLERELAANLPIKAVVAMTYVGNDFFDCVTDKNLRIVDGILGDPGGFKSALKRKSHLYRLAANALHHVKVADADARPEEAALYKPEGWTAGKLKEALPIFRAEFVKIRDLCKGHDLPLLVVVIPTDHTVDSPAPPNDLPVMQAMTVLADENIRCLDLTPLLINEGAKKTYLGWDFHFNAHGNQIAAEAITQAWLDSPK